jgi:hypothetical protein
MPRLGETRYSFSVPHRRVLQWDRTQTVRLEAHRDGSLAAPSSGTYTLYDPDGTKLVDGAAVTITDNVATCTVLQATLPTTLTLGEGYWEEWSLVMPDSTTRTPRVLAALSRFPLHPTAAEGDITGEYPTLDRDRPRDIDSWQDFIDRAWDDILRRLTREGAWSYLAVDSSGFYEAHLHCALMRVFRFLMQKVSAERFEKSYQIHKNDYERAWAELKSAWDHDHDGQPDDATALHGVARSVMPAGAPVNRSWGGYRW